MTVNMTVKQVARKLSVSASLIYSLCQAGLILHTRHGRPGKRGTIRITDEAVAAYLEASKRVAK